jgi:hypothetical protein
MAKKKSFADFLREPGSGWRGLLTLQAVSVAVGFLNTVWSIVVKESVKLLLLSALFTLLFAVIMYLTSRRAKPRILTPAGAPPTKHAGLIVLVGPGRPGEDPMSQSAGLAITHHMSTDHDAGLRKCWLITPRTNPSAMEVASKLLAKCVEKTINAKIVTIEDPFDVQATYDAVRSIYNEEAAASNLERWQVIADFTGGTKPMTAGVVLACGQDWPMQYMYGRAEGVPSTPRRIEFKLGS